MSNVFAYLVGVDTYAGNVAQLRGCVNDVDAIVDLLRKRAAASGDTLTLARLTNEAANRSAFIDGFRSFFAGCGDDDVALLYCSMHGSQEKAPPEFLPVEPDGYNETLVFHDSRSDGGWDLADKELSVLVGELSSKGVYVTVVLDCCHSGSGVRGLTEEIGVRRAPIDLRSRGAAEYLPGTLAAAREAASSDPSARYTLLAACQSDQTAKESAVGGVQRGALSAALEQVLLSVAGPTSNLLVHRAVSARVRGQVSDQTPQLECPVGADVDRAFLDGTATATRSLLTVSHVAGAWQLDAGRVHGIPPIGPDLSGVTLELYPLASSGAAPALATAITTVVKATTSELRFEPPDGAGALDESRGYYAAVRAWSQPTITVSVGADVSSREAVVAGIEAAAGIRVGDADPDLLVVRVGDLVELHRPDSTRPVVAEQPAALLEVDRLVAEVAQIGRWLGLWQLANPSSSFASDDVTLEVVGADGGAVVRGDGGVRVSYQADGAGGWTQPRVQLRIRNNSGRRVYIALLDLTELFGVNVLNLEGNGLLDPAGDQATGVTFAIADDGSHDLYLELPTGQAKLTDLVKLLVSTTPIDALDWRQENLRPPTRTRGAITADRDLSGRPAGRVPTDDWTTREVLLTTVRPVGTVTLGGDGSPVELASGVMLHAPAGFSATVALNTKTEAGRDALVPLLPPVFADDPASEPFALIPTRSVGSELDVLDIRFPDTQRASTVTVSVNNPLRLVVDQVLSDAEAVLPIVFDGVDYLPVGSARTVGGRTEIVIDRLPVSDVGLRSLGGSLKILFRKLILRPLGVPHDWPRLSLVSYDTDPPTYDWDAARVRAALAGKQSVLLLVHGIIGDTRGMSAAAGAGPVPFKNGFDAVLAFDYENIQTPIEQSGLDIGGRLRDVGITPGADVRVTAVVHSMGGLVSRCFIEKDGGAPMIERFITCGTPHDGSPWPKIEDLALSVVGLGLNSILGLGGPLAIAGRILGYLTKLTETLDEMAPTSALIQGLAQDADPGLRYVAIRGTRPWPDSADDARAKRIIAKLATIGFDEVFASAPNDMAVSVASASSVGRDWAKPPVLLDADCNHISYFSSEPGQVAIHEALRHPL